MAAVDAVRVRAADADLLVATERGPDLDKTDDMDAVLIARLTAQLRCYAPEPVDETWGRLRHLGARREELIVANVAQIQQIRDLLECVWPAASETARQPFRSQTWAAAMTVIVDRDAGPFREVWGGSSASPQALTT